MPRGPSQEIQAQAFLAHASRDAAAVLEAVSVRVGAVRTPGGLVVAA